MGNSRDIAKIPEADLIDRARRLLIALTAVVEEWERRERAKSSKIGLESATPSEATPARRVS